jgi:hypothetical protein
VLFLAVSSVAVIARSIWKSESTKSQQAIQVQFDEKEGLKLVNDLFNAVNPSLPENSYMPALMKEKISWIYRRSKEKKLIIHVTTAYFQTESGEISKKVLMSSAYSSEKSVGFPAHLPIIEIYFPRLWTLFRVEENIEKGFSQMAKNAFALALTHEAVHLEKGESEFISRINRPDLFWAEEERTYIKVDLEAVRLLRLAGQPVATIDLEMDNVWQGCGDKLPCPEFTRYLKNMGGEI